jgi:hypothetical protein
MAEKFKHFESIWPRQKQFATGRITRDVVLFARRLKLDRLQDPGFLATHSQTQEKRLTKV